MSLKINLLILGGVRKMTLAQILIKFKTLILILIHLNLFKSSYWRCSGEKVFSKFRNFHRKTHVLESLFEETRTEVFSCEICKFLRTPILKNICEQLLLPISYHWFLSITPQKHQKTSASPLFFWYFQRVLKETSGMKLVNGAVLCIRLHVAWSETLLKSTALPLLVRHSVHWEHLPLSCQAPIKFANCPSPPLYRFFVNPPPLKVGFFSESLKY